MLERSDIANRVNSGEALVFMGNPEPSRACSPFGRGARKVQRLGGEETITRPRAPDTPWGDDIVCPAFEDVEDAEVVHKKLNDNNGLQEAYSMISPEETPFHLAVGTKTVTQPKFEWPTVDLAALDYGNRVIEGDDAPGTDNATLAKRLSNYAQISDKTISVSHTSDASDAAAENIQELSEQVALKLRELKRDCEGMILDNVAANPGASGTARVSAGLPAFLRTNLKLRTGNLAPTLSGGTEGYPNAPLTPATSGNKVALNEADFNEVIEKCWNEGADPTLAMVNSNNKRVISSEFTGSSTRYKDAVDRQLVASIDIYTSDFGELQVVPNRFMPTANRSSANDDFSVYILDPNFARICELETTKQKPLAEIGHSRKRLIWREWGLQVDNEKAHGAVHGTTGAAS